MRTSKRLWRASLLVLLLAALCGSFAFPVADQPVQAAPPLAPSTTIVISQIYGGGGNTDAPYTNDFVELFNPSANTVTFTNWSIQYAGATSASWSVTSFSGQLLAGQYYLVALGSGGAIGNPLPSYDALGSMNLAATAGKVALVKSTTALTCGSSNDCLPNPDIIDFVGYGSTASSYEGSGRAPAPSNTTAVMRGSKECFDTDNNSTDFITGTPDPHNTSTFLNACLKVVNVTSNTLDGTYRVGDPVIGIDITFSNNVNVDLSGGIPTLTLETGANDTKAIYVSGSGTPKLTFNYTIVAGDTSRDLDYKDTNSLLLNGAKITGAVGDAILTLPIPSGAGSLGDNENIAIDNQLDPTVTVNQASSQPDPAGAFPINFTVVFSEPISSFTSSDITQDGTATGVTWAISSSSDDMTFTLSATAATSTGTVIPSIGANQVTDGFGNENLASTSADNEVLYNNVPITVTVEQSTSGQLDPTDNTPINFEVTFSNAINVSSFTTSDITQNGTATGVTWRITDLGDHRHFTLSAIAITAPGTTTLKPSIQPDNVTDIAGNTNNASTSVDNEVTFNNNIGPSVTVNQASGQIDPTTILPIRFSIVFSEAINPSTFSTADITQTGTATGLNWVIADSGDHTNFALSATAATGYGTLIPIIAPNRVTDLVGNNNLGSTSTDNSVSYTTTTTNTTSVVISEFRTRGPAGSNDEFIEIYNPTTNPVDISGWKINASGETGSVETRATIPASTLLRSGQYYLIANSSSSGGYSNTTTTANLTYGSGIADGGGIALLNATNVVADQVGMSAGSAYKEGATLAPLSGDLDRSYERKLGGTSDSCQDTNNNSSDFANRSPSNPHNYASPLSLCGTSRSSPVATTTTITADTPDPSVVNGSVSVSVTVTGGSTVPTGKVNITGANTNCTITLSAGKGSCSAIFSSTGTKTITATYLGDNTYLASSDTETHQVSSVSTYRTPTAVAPPPPPPLVAINEFVPRPGHDWNHDGIVNVKDEYIELLNHGTVDVNLSGYSLDDEVNLGSAPYRLPIVTLKPGQRVVFFGSETGLLLSDGGDGVRLLKPNGQLADAYNYFVVGYPDQSYCRIPDNGGADDWNQNCFPTPGLQNSLNGDFVSPPGGVSETTVCPISDTLPNDFVQAECDPFGMNIWRRAFWDLTGWFEERSLPEIESKWPVFAD